MYDVVLIGGFPKSYGYQKPIGMYRIATELRTHGYSVQCIDLFTEMDESTLFKVFSTVISSETKVLGITTTLLKSIFGGEFFGVPDKKFITIVEQAKTLNPNIKIVLGGSQIEAHALEELEQFKDHIDLCVAGQGETAILAIMDHLIHGADLDVEIINGIPFTSDKKYEFDTFNRSSIQFQPNDIISPEESLCIEVARGCVFRCAYCFRDLNGKSFGDMTKHEEILREELIRNYELFGTTNYYIADDTINDSMKKVEYLHKIFTSLPFKLQFSSFGRLDLIWKYTEMANILQEMGMVGISFGIETLHQEAGRLVGKGLGEKKIKETLEICKDVWKDDVSLCANFICGLPKEPVASINRTFDWLISDDCPVDCAAIHPLYISQNRKNSRMDTDKDGKFLCEFSGARHDEWKHEHLTFSGAVALKKRFESRLINKWPLYYVFNAFALPRLNNIGVSVDESLRVNRSLKSGANNVRLQSQQERNVAAELFKRTRRRRDEYTNSLINFSH
ncbi:MAG: radical SAM protein [Gammaproteobacteria bacterium]|nr:MAG: radical SAM protein [Gammaproteobacteria bacterium]